jgi:tetratricopeptide (TPR) repeat protein
MKPIRPKPTTGRTAAPFARPPRPGGHRLGRLNPREWWWWLLDLFEASRAARIALYLAATGIVAGGALWLWVYPLWTKHSSIKVARAWLDAGQFRYAAEAAQQAAALDPDNPEPWHIASELARLGGQQDKSLDYARRAARLAPENPDLVVSWAAAAVRADQPAEADRALDQLPIETQAGSPHVQRLRGELARRQLNLTAARGYFESALRLEGSLAINEVPLGLILLQSSDPALRRRGGDLLAKWTADREWGVTAVRTLLTDALILDDRSAMLRWGDLMLASPGRTHEDMAQGLLALSRSSEYRFAAVLAQLEKDHAVSPQAATQLLGWLNRIGRAAEAIKWIQTLPAAAVRRPPLVVAWAESLRLTGDWSTLRDLTAEGEWGGEVDFLRWAYGLLAARRLGEEIPADSYERTLYARAQLNSVHGMFAASSLYSWGRTPEAEALWWRVAEQDSRLAVEALGSLARHYQMQRDADGQYRVFRRLHSLQPQDPGIGNNFAFFAALTHREQRMAERLARANLAAAPANAAYLATTAFILTQQGQAAEALTLLEPRKQEIAQSPALAFAYGLALAGTGRKTEARPLLAGLPPETLTLTEVDLIKSVLAN